MLIILKQSTKHGNFGVGGCSTPLRRSMLKSYIRLVILFSELILLDVLSISNVKSSMDVGLSTPTKIFLAFSFQFQ